MPAASGCMEKKWQILMQYSQYLQNHFGCTCTVVFDGYNGKPSVKDEHTRRATMSCPDIDVTEQKEVYRRLSEFMMNNNNNKQLFVTLLTKHLREKGMQSIKLPMMQTH